MGLEAGKTKPIRNRIRLRACVGVIDLHGAVVPAAKATGRSLGGPDVYYLTMPASSRRISLATLMVLALAWNPFWA